MSNITVWSSAKCTGSEISYIQLRNLTFPTEYTCNGYKSLNISFAYDVILNDNTLEKLPISNTSVYITYLNVTGGRCSGDVLFLFTTYLADDQHGCSNGKGLYGLTVDHIYGRLTGSKCPSNCTLDTDNIQTFWVYIETIIRTKMLSNN
ncbi:unnamed protein product, partial [Oppiella nova]